MRITRQQAEQNRRKVVEAADTLFREKGFEAVTVADLMRAAGLSHGGFYNHFDSKAALEAAVVGQACAGAAERLAARTQGGAPSARRDALARYIESYVSSAMRDAPAPFCAMLAYGADIPRSAPPTRAAFAAGLGAYLDRFAAALAPEDPESAHARAARAFSTMIGALILARATASADPTLSDEILAAARDGLDETGAGEG